MKWDAGLSTCVIFLGEYSPFSMLGQVFRGGTMDRAGIVEQMRVFHRARIIIGLLRMVITMVRAIKISSYQSRRTRGRAHEHDLCAGQCFSD